MDDSNGTSITKDSLLTRLRGVVGNALIWGVGWAAFWVLAVMGFALLGLVGVTSGLTLGEALFMAVRFGIGFGILGFAAGAVFSGALGLLYRGRRLSDIGWVRVGIGGAVLGGVFTPLFLQAMNLLTGGELMPWANVLGDGLWSAVFGGVVAGGSILVARRADRLLSDGDGDGSGGGGELSDGRSELSDGRGELSDPALGGRAKERVRGGPK